MPAHRRGWEHRVIQAEIVWDLRELGALGEDWQRLFAAGHSEPSTSLEWSDALLKSHVRESDLVFVVVLREAGSVVSLVPAIVRREQVLGPLNVAVLSFLSELHNTHSDILRAADRPDVVAALFGALTSVPCRWDVFSARRLLESGPLARQMTDFAGQSGYPCRIRREQPSFILDLRQGYDAFLRARSGKFRNYLKRKTRQLAALGQVEVRRAGRDMSLADAYEDLLAVDSRSWKQANGSAIPARPEQRAFYRLLGEGALRHDRLHLTLLYLDGRPIAFNYGLTLRDTYYYIKTSFDEEFRRVSPATVLRAQLVRSLVEEGIQVLDFPAEPYQWEEQWTDQMRWHRSILLFNRTPRGLFYRAVIGLRDAFRRRADDGDVRYVDPRSLSVQ